MDIRKILASSLLFLLITQISQGQIIGKVTDIQNKPQVAFIYADGTGRSCYSDTNGNFELSLKRGTYTIVCFSEGFQSQSTIVKYSGEKKRIDFNLSPLSLELKEVIIEGSRAEDLGMKWLQSIEGAAIFESKKTELINIEELVGNLAINSSRQVYARVPGLNIFENDGAGLQLAIGARGLDPNRTSNFNV